MIKEPVFEDGKVIGIVGLINDITEKTLLDEKVKELHTFDMLTKLLSQVKHSQLLLHHVK